MLGSPIVWGRIRARRLCCSVEGGLVGETEAHWARTVAEVLHGMAIPMLTVRLCPGNRGEGCCPAKESMGDVVFRRQYVLLQGWLPVSF